MTPGQLKIHYNVIAIPLCTGFCTRFKQGSCSTALFTTEKNPRMWTGWVQTHVVQGSTVNFPMHTALINLKSIV